MIRSDEFCNLINEIAQYASSPTPVHVTVSTQPTLKVREVVGFPFRNKIESTGEGER